MKMGRIIGVIMLMLLAGCGSQPTIPVEEHSSVKPPPQRERYYRAAPVARPEVAKPSSARPYAVTPYQPVEPEPAWREIPPAQPHSAEPVQSRPLTAPTAKVPESIITRDDPLLGVMGRIEQAMQQGDYKLAEGLLERALRIDSQRAGLWHDLAQVRFHQQAYAEAVTLARRSNSLTSRGGMLQEENWSLIARSKEALGDLQGARAAWRKAGRGTPTTLY